MDFKKIIFTCGLICGFLVSPMVYANDTGSSSSEHSNFSEKKQERMGKKIQEIYNQLNLTKEQKEQLENNKSKTREKRKILFDKMRSYKETLNQELMRPELDMNKINEIQTQFKTLQSQMTDDRLNSMLDVRKILTPQQFSKFLSLMERYKHQESSIEEK